MTKTLKSFYVTVECAKYIEEQSAKEKLSQSKYVEKKIMGTDDVFEEDRFGNLTRLSDSQVKKLLNT